MAQVIVSLKVMPESLEVNLDELKEKVGKCIEEFGGSVGKIEVEDVAFGLKCLKFLFSSDEEKSNLDPLEEKIKAIDGVKSADVIDVRRAVG